MIGQRRQSPTSFRTVFVFSSIHPEPAEAAAGKERAAAGEERRQGLRCRQDPCLVLLSSQSYGRTHAHAHFLTYTDRLSVLEDPLLSPPRGPAPAAPHRLTLQTPERALPRLCTESQACLHLCIILSLGSQRTIYGQDVVGSSYSAVLLLGWPGLMGGQLGIRRWAGRAGLEADSDYAIDRMGRLGLCRRPDRTTRAMQSLWDRHATADVVDIQCGQ